MQRPDTLTDIDSPAAKAPVKHASGQPVNVTDRLSNFNYMICDLTAMHRYYDFNHISTMSSNDTYLIVLASYLTIKPGIQ